MARSEAAARLLLGGSRPPGVVVDLLVGLPPLTLIAGIEPRGAASNPEPPPAACAPAWLGLTPRPCTLARLANGDEREIRRLRWGELCPSGGRHPQLYQPTGDSQPVVCMPRVSLSTETRSPSPPSRLPGGKRVPRGPTGGWRSVGYYLLPKSPRAPRLGRSSSSRGLTTGH